MFLDVNLSGWLPVDAFRCFAYFCVFVSLFVCFLFLVCS